MQTVVEQIKDRLPITDVLSSYITITQAGKQYKAKCPFHNEKTASFSISPDRGLYYCFGCGAKGDIFTFVQQFEGVDFNGSLKILADRAGVELREHDRHRDDTDPLYVLLEKTTQRFQNELQKNTEALRYLKGRGVTEQTIADFRLGYAPTEWRFVADTCQTDADRSIALRAGLIKNPDGDSAGQQKRPYDRFRGRIMFPLTDSSGRVVGFSGRLFPEQKHEEGAPTAPKYLNSPETEVFQKSRVLFGFDKAKFHIKRHGFAILVEGQMDLILSHQMGFRNTIATSGTAVSEQSAEDDRAHLSVLSRLVPHVFLAFDGDAAGQKALQRAALVALSLGMNPKVVSLPENIDPADFLLTKGPEAWKVLLQQSLHFIVHQARHVRKENLSPHMLVRALRESVFPYLSRVVSPIEQNLYTEAVAKEIGIPVDEVAREHARFVAEQSPDGSFSVKEVETTRESKEQFSARERLTAFAIRFPSDETTASLEKLAHVTFEDKMFGNLDTAITPSPQLLALIEQQYGMLTEKECSVALSELTQKALDEFFTDIHKELSHALHHAETNGNEQETERILGRLVALNTQRRESV